MKRMLVVAAILALGIGLAGAAEETDAIEAADATCADPYDEEALLAAGFEIVSDSSEAAGGVPDCPSVSGCGGFNVICRSDNCSAQDTGNRKCRLPDRTMVKCGQGTTVHINNCSCTTVSQAFCCTQDPACLCAPCSSGSSFLSCQ